MHLARKRQANHPTRSTNLSRMPVLGQGHLGPSRFATFVAVEYGFASLFEFGQTPFSVYTGAELVVSAGV